MSDQLIMMLTIFYAVVTLIVVVVAIVFTLKNMKKQYTNTLTNLERNKNLIISGSILSELNKVESLINNKDLEDKYNYWKKLFKELKDKDVPKIKDELLEDDNIFSLLILKDDIAH